MKAKRVSLIIITLSVLATVLFGTTIAFARDNSKKHIDELCEQNYIAPEIVYATIESGYEINVDEYINTLSRYADLAGTDEEVDIAEAISETLKCSLDEAIRIIDKSDSMQNKN